MVNEEKEEEEVEEMKKIEGVGKKRFDSVPSRRTVLDSGGRGGIGH